MNAEKLLSTLELIDPELIDEAGRENPAKRAWLRRLAAAACLLLTFVGALHVTLELDFWASGCSASPGVIAGGTYYYYVQHSGVWSYSPGAGSQKEVGAYGLDEWDANDYGVYYVKGRSLYVKPRETGKAQRLYRSSFWESTHIRFSLMADGKLYVTVYNKRAEIKYGILLDGQTGALLETVMEPTSYSDYSIPYDKRYFPLGNTVLERAAIPTGERDSRYELRKNGVSILPEGTSVWDVQPLGGNLVILYGYPGGDSVQGLVLCPDETSCPIPSQLAQNINFQTGAGQYLYYVEYGPVQNAVWCYEIATGKSWPLTVNGGETEFYSIVTDGVLLYSCAPWDSAQACWQILYEEELPVGLILQNADVTRQPLGG